MTERKDRFRAGFEVGADDPECGHRVCGTRDRPAHGDMGRASGNGSTRHAGPGVLAWGLRLDPLVDRISAEYGRRLAEPAGAYRQAG